MHVTALELENYRGFERLSLGFHPEVTVLVGANGSGKSTVLEALALVFGPGQEEREPADPNAVRLGASEARIFANARIRNDQPATLLLEPGGSRWIGEWDALRGTWDSAGRPLLCGYPVARRANDLTPGSKDPTGWPPEAAYRDAWPKATSFEQFFAWFREREDFENELRSQDTSHRDPQLEAVRRAVAQLMPGYSNLRVRRFSGRMAKPSMVITKAGTEFMFDQLSEGERTLTALFGDISRRLAITNQADPLAGDGVVLIDEIELHLHPKWQADIIPALRRTFPNLQFIVTTHSPVVLSRVPTECVRVLEDFKVYDAPGKTEGRDPNGLLMEIFDTPLRPADVQRALGEIARLIDNDDIAAARESLEALAERLGDQDSEVTRLRTVLDVLAS